MQEFYTFYFAKYKHKFLIQMFSNRYVYNSVHTNLDRVVTNLDRVVTKKMEVFTLLYGFPLLYNFVSYNRRPKLNYRKT